MGVDPITIGLAIASGVSSIAGSQAQKQQAQYQAGVAKNNQRIALMNAGYANRVGVQKEQSEAWKVRAMIGQQAAAQAANGLDINSGSAAQVRDSTAELGKLSFGNIRDNAAREEYGYLAQATQFGNEAKLAKASAPSTFSTLLGAATAAAGTYTKLGGTFNFGGSSPAKAAPIGGVLSSASLFSPSQPNPYDWQNQFGPGILRL